MIAGTLYFVYVPNSECCIPGAVTYSADFACTKFATGIEHI